MEYQYNKKLIKKGTYVDKSEGDLVVLQYFWEEKGDLI